VDLIIGGASGYEWDKIKVWAKSAREHTGIQNEVVLVATNMSRVTIEKCSEAGIKLVLYGTARDDGVWEDYSSLPPHVSRLFHVWNYLNMNRSTYTNVVFTDVRDVLFQRDPFSFNIGDRKLLVSGEGLRYQDEPWGRQNIIDTFGEFFAAPLMGLEILNVGVIGGKLEYVCDVLLHVFQMCLNRPVKICDQAAFNFLMRSVFYEDALYMARPNQPWACQLGTTQLAVQAGAGDLGMTYRHDMRAYQDIYRYYQPEIKGGLVFCPDTALFHIVHQWDRVPELKAIIEAKYE